MRSLGLATLNRIAGRVVSARSFVTIYARTRDTGDEVPFHFWNDAGPTTVTVLDELAGGTDTRTFVGGAIVSISDIRLTSDIAVRTVDIAMSAIHASVIDMVRTHDIRAARVQIYRGYLDPATLTASEEAISRFVGFVDRAPIGTSAEGGASAITITCASHTRELTRKSTDVRSHESQLKRAAGDTFYKDTGVVGDWDISWGENRKKAGSGGIVAGTGFVRAGEAAQ